MMIWLTFSAASVKISAVSVRKVINFEIIKILCIIFNKKIKFYEKTIDVCARQIEKVK